ncbi:MAG: nucleotide exchange factor GrpE [Calditerricola sp.]|nr:nucleotide exchange factor GrpE [Calditerricola sp.]
MNEKQERQEARETTSVEGTAETAAANAGAPQEGLRSAPGSDEASQAGGTPQPEAAAPEPCAAGEGTAGGETDPNRGGATETDVAALKARVAELEGEVAALKAQVQEAHERFLRARADLENARRRFEKEKQDALTFGALRLVERLLPVLDNFERALAAGKTTDNVDALVKGIEMIHRQLDQALRQEGLEPIEALGKPFDPNIHEAVMQAESSDHPPGTVIEELQKGYTFKGRLVRPTMVKVSK